MASKTIKSHLEPSPFTLIIDHHLHLRLLLLSPVSSSPIITEQKKLKLMKSIFRSGSLGYRQPRKKIIPVAQHPQSRRVNGRTGANEAGSIGW
ncbi:hypothetical protein SLEP1_g20075 [Rubroshorea leprosula]|uniref:Uncharacterized protein n=1 Tax=Rubroshorea leprosula TaxID=152421 RepID=A0AAV5J6X9_9ROSI|nr:hypothetical protein SLEP1_g20075 [Rubroshorea leprosula]